MKPSLAKPYQIARNVGSVLWNALRDFLYPPVCPLCCRPRDASVSRGEPAHAFCNDCRASLTPEERDQCPRCGAPVGPHLWDPAGCQYCRDDRFAFERVVALDVYDGLYRTACLRMKRGDGLPLAYAMGEFLGEQTAERLRNIGMDAVVAVPQHWMRRMRRHRNSSEILAGCLARKLNIPLLRDALRKVRRTPRQFSLPPSKRRTNLRNAFAAELPKNLQSATLLLVDDVLTTGTTAHEASRALLTAGAGRVVVAVAARGVGD